MLLAFELSGEHDTLPGSEIFASLEVMNVAFKVHLSLDGCLLIDLENDTDNIASTLAEKLSMTHHIIKVTGISGSDEKDILTTIENSDVNFEGTYSIRVRRIKEYSSLSTASMERKIGGIFFRKGFHADLEYPSVQYRLLLTENMSVFGYIIASVDRSVFETRKPQRKPFFYPGVLMPRVARALVNISKAERNLFDPFCGTGGILVEAGLLGLECIGGDVQRKLLLGAKMNLDFYEINYTLMYQDACRLSLRDESVDSVVTDPPYGISALIEADSKEDLIRGSMNEIKRVLRKGNRAVFISGQGIDKIINESGFKLVEMHLQRVHKSLTRHIYVLEK